MIRFPIQGTLSVGFTDNRWQAETHLQVLVTGPCSSRDVQQSADGPSPRWPRPLSNGWSLSIARKRNNGFRSFLDWLDHPGGGMWLMRLDSYVSGTPRAFVSLKTGLLTGVRPSIRVIASPARAGQIGRRKPRLVAPSCQAAVPVAVETCSWD